MSVTQIILFCIVSIECRLERKYAAFPPVTEPRERSFMNMYVYYCKVNAQTD